jgi:ketosteroid isomerase-like protein
MGHASEEGPGPVTAAMLQAMNAHDLETFVSLFDPDYRSEQPAHPGRAFQGSEQVRSNWSAVFEDIPDFHAELVRSISNGNTEWAEWDWRGTRSDGTPFVERGVTIIGIREGRIAWGRLYVELVEETSDVEELVDDMTHRQDGG